MHINTMGFRGEALASIGSIAEVELKTKTQNDKIGTLINIDNSKIKKWSKNHQKRPESGPESTVWLENRSRSIPGLLRSVSDQSLTPKKVKKFYYFWFDSKYR